MTAAGFVAGFLSLVAPAAVQGQFHQQDQKGGVKVNREAVQSASRAGAATTTGAAVVGGKGEVGANPYSTIYLNEAQKRAFGVRLGKQDDLQITKWGRAIHHPDGTYTQSVAEPGMSKMEQETRSKNGTLLQRRLISLDEYGRAKEVLIYDGRDTFKYRGILFYDGSGRFREEQLFAANGTPLRRKVQEYDLEGKKLPLRSWDYVDNVPSDLQLVVTRQAGDEVEGELESPESMRERKPLFGNRDRTAEPSRTGARAASDGERSSQKLGRLFGARQNGQ